MRLFKGLHTAGTTLIFQNFLTEPLSQELKLQIVSEQRKRMMLVEVLRVINNYLLNSTVFS